MGFILYKFVKSPNRHLGPAVRNVRCVRRFSPTLHLMGFAVQHQAMSDTDSMRLWLVGQTKHPQLHYYRNLALRILRPSFTVKRLRWYGHVQQAMSHIKSITDFPIPAARKQGRPRKTWSECVKTDVSNCGLAGVDPLDRDAWRAGVRHSLVLPIPQNGTRTAS